MLSNEGNVFFVGDFDDSAEKDLVVTLPIEIQKQRSRREGDRRIDLWINSFGGYAHLVMHLTELVEVAKRDGITVRTIVPSVAFSAGSMLAITGTPGERYISRDAEHLIHYGSTGSVETTPVQADRFHQWKSRDFKRTIAHYKRYSNVPDIDSHMADDGFFVPAAKCIKYGLADKYMDKFDIGDFKE